MAERRWTEEEKLACLRRELKQREYVYPRRVEAGKMSRPKMEEELDLIRAIIADYEGRAQSERLL